VSHGRLILGIGAGWNEPEYRAFGLPFDRRVDRFEEALQIIVPLLREGHATFEGKYYTVHDCELAPRGPRAAGPPLLIGASGPRMLRLAARYADLWNEADYVVRPEAFEPRRAAFDAARNEEGQSGAEVGISVVLKVGWSDLGDLPGFFGSDWLTGSAEEVAAVFQAWADSGVSHVICQCHPNTPAALDRLIAGLQFYRATRPV
jgi:alkanesulfonate monooxygenase SsuD/methylene tetrahydromethanopterin reductase-like flavin-dependent oxidoreductase (luciferase family)